MTDGEIFWRVTKGIIEGDNIIMPTYENKATDTERWLLVEEDLNGCLVAELPALALLDQHRRNGRRWCWAHEHLMRLRSP